MTAPTTVILALAGQHLAWSDLTEAEGRALLAATADAPGDADVARCAVEALLEDGPESFGSWVEPVAGCGGVEAAT